MDWCELELPSCYCSGRSELELRVACEVGVPGAEACLRARAFPRARTALDREAKLAWWTARSDIPAQRSRVLGELPGWRQGYWANSQAACRCNRGKWAFSQGAGRPRLNIKSLFLQEKLR